MIELSDLAAASLARGNQRRFLRVEAWYGDELLDDDVPVSSGQLEVDRGSNVPERVTLTVPRQSRGVDYTPTQERSPLGANGQLIRLQVGLGIDRGQVEWLPRGWYAITQAEPRGDAVEVEAAGLLWLIDEARLVSPFQPSGTFVSTVRGLVEPALTVTFDAALVDRAVPAGVNYDDDRLGALNATLAAWPAEAAVTPDGYLLVVPAVDAAALALALTDGVGGTVIEARGTSTRDGAYNAVVARGLASDGGVVQGVAYDYTTPKRVGGPFNDLVVPMYFESPLLTTAAQAQAAADTRLATLMRSTSRTFEVEMVPHPGIEAGDRVELTTSLEVSLPAIVEGLRLPLTPAGGAQTLTVRTVL